MTPLCFKSFNTPNQNLDDSFSPIHIPNISLYPSLLIPKTIYAAFFTTRFSSLTLKCTASINIIG